MWMMVLGHSVVVRYVVVKGPVLAAGMWMVMWWLIGMRRRRGRVT